MAWQNKPDVFPWEDAYVALRVDVMLKDAKFGNIFASFALLEAISHDSIAKSDDDDALT